MMDNVIVHKNYYRNVILFEYEFLVYREVYRTLVIVTKIIIVMYILKEIFSHEFFC